jgi:probable phosphoglycerate mutase
VEAYCIRHGETAWSLSGQHTGRTDIPLTENGRRLAAELRPLLDRHDFARVLSSPLQRARETCALAGFGERCEIEPDLSEWDYGDYEGLTPSQIHAIAPGWMLFRDGCPAGETAADVAKRVDRLIGRLRAERGDVALFAHGHVLRVFGARWIGLAPEEGRRFLLGTGTISILGEYRGDPAIAVWNGAQG